MVVTTRSTKRTASEALTENSTGARKQHLKKQRVENTNKDISAADGIYKDTAKSLSDRLRLPIRGKGKKVDTFRGNGSAAPLSVSKHTVTGTQSPVVNVTDHTSKAAIPALPIAHTNPQYGNTMPAQVYAPKYETQEMLGLWHSTWVHFKKLIQEDGDSTRTMPIEMWSKILSQEQSWFSLHPNLGTGKAVTASGFLASLTTTRPKDKKTMKAAFTSSVWEWTTVRETHLEQPDMYGEDLEDFGGKMVTAQEQKLWETIAELYGLQHVRNLSVLSTRRRIEGHSYSYSTLPIVAEKTAAMFQKQFEGHLTFDPAVTSTASTTLKRHDGYQASEPAINTRTAAEFQKGYKDYVASEPAISLTDAFMALMMLKDRLMVQEKQQNIFWPPPGAVFDPVCMEATTAGTAPSGISKKEASKYRVVICLWPGLASVKETIDLTGWWYGDYERALLEKREWVSGRPELWKEWETDDTATVTGRAVVVVEKLA